MLFIELRMPKDRQIKADLFRKFDMRFVSFPPAFKSENHKLDATGLLDAVSQYVKDLSPEYREMVISMIQDDPEERMTWKQFFEHPLIKSMPDLYRLLIGEAL